MIAESDEPEVWGDRALAASPSLQSGYEGRGFTFRPDLPPPSVDLRTLAAIILQGATWVFRPRPRLPEGLRWLQEVEQLDLFNTPNLDVNCNRVPMWVDAGDEGWRSLS